MKKWSIFLVVIIFLLAFMVVTMCSCNANSEPSKLRIVKEESYFAGYEIKGDRVIFSYSICFANDYEEDFDILFSARFKKSELKGWFERDEKDTSFISGSPVIGEWKNFIIKSGEKKNVLLYFEGQYLGGEVNENLSFPLEIMLSTSF